MQKHIQIISLCFLYTVDSQFACFLIYKRALECPRIPLCADTEARGHSLTGTLKKERHYNLLKWCRSKAECRERLNTKLTV